MHMKHMMHMEMSVKMNMPMKMDASTLVSAEQELTWARAWT